MSRRHDDECELNEPCYRHGKSCNCGCGCAVRALAEMRRLDAINRRAELRDRLDRCTDADHGAAFGWLCDNHPDLVREALDETGAP